VESSARMVCIDSLTVKTSTLTLDSIKTSNTQTALVGGYDKSVGKVNSRSYITLGKSVSNVNRDAVFDSITLNLVPSSYYFGDTTSLFHMTVNRITEDIKYPLNDQYLYNVSHFAYDSLSTLGEVTFKPKPKEKKKIRIKIDDALGIDLLDKLKARTNSFEDVGGFSHYFKGIVLNSHIDGNNKSIIGFSTTDTSITMSLYYHYITNGNIIKDRVKFEPSVGNTNIKQFNQITSDRSGTDLSTISEVPTSSELLKNYSYVQGGSGLVTRIDFPSLKNLLEQDRKFEVVNATLFVQPSVETMESDFLPQKLNLCLTNKHNDYLTILSKNNVALNGSRYIDYINKENTHYSWDISGFIKQLLVSDKYVNGLFLIPENYNKAFDYIIISDQKKSHYKTYLKLYIIYYE